MTSLDELLGDEYKTPGAQLSFDLAQEHQHLLGRLIEIRRQRFSQEQMAEILGVTQATVSAFERLGNDPKLSTLRRYCKALNVMVRHVVDEQPAACVDSSYVSHVSDNGVSVHDTAAAVARKIKHEGLGNWPAARNQDLARLAETAKHDFEFAS